MAGQRTDVKTWLLGSALLLTGSLLSAPSHANTIKRVPAAPITRHVINASYRVSPHVRLPFVVHAVAYSHGRIVNSGGRHIARGGRGGISCVPYARQVSGIVVGGNAWQWWDNAAGLYARGNHPETGSVLSFRANPRMRLGHVAVVRRVINPREITVDQANWPSMGMRGGVSHDVAVVDVSEANDWSAVRVELGRGAAFGAVYPTHGFIYDRPDRGVVEASLHAPAPPPALNPAPRDLRPVAERPWHSYEEVAEAPDAAPKRINLSLTSGTSLR
jgi:surface antigen